MSEIRTTTLPSGLRVITDRVPGMYSVAAGIWVGAGTRHEEMQHNGTAHLLEHMLFKGTKKRSAQDIAEVIENVGGNMNAYTSREITSYHVHLLKEDLRLGIDVIADIAQNATMPDQELERERHVVLQEIGMTEDTPDDLVFDHYYETAYPCQTIGAPILGKRKIIEKISTAPLKDFVKNYYTPSRVVVSAAGNLDHEAFVADVGELFQNLPQDTQHDMPKAEYKGGENRGEKALEQSHLILGFQGVPRTDDDYYAAMTLATLMGGGMSSRLFQEVREKRGLVYSIFSFHSAYIDSGQFAIYAGTGPEDLPTLIPVVCDEIKKVLEKISDQEINRAKAQLRADLLMGRESLMTRAGQQAKYMLFFDKQLDINILIEHINKVDITAVQRAAKRIFTSKPTLAGLGPLSTLEAYDKISQRLAA